MKVSSRREWLRASLLGAVLLSLAWTQAGAPGRIVAVGDVHGDLSAFTSILQETGLIDEQSQWAGGNAVLVQTGDLLDRGTEIRAVLDLLMRLQRQAPAQGGEVVSLWGNHEIMNLVLELRDNDPSQYVAFADTDSGSRREREYAEYAALAPKIDALDVENALGFEVLDRDTWMAANPPGRLEYIAAISPEGEYGKWLRERAFATKVGDSLFLHAGIGGDDVQRSIEEIDRAIHDELATFDAARKALVDSGWALSSFGLNDLIRVAALLLQHPAEASALTGKGRSRPFSMPGRWDVEAMARLVNLTAWTSFRPDGPMWYRGYDPRRPVVDFEARFAELLARYEVNHVVVGHTPQAGGRIRAVLDGALFMIDTGMLARVYQGRPAALQIENGEFTAIYLDARERLCCGPPPGVSASTVASVASATAAPERAWRDREGAPLPFGTNAEIEQFLREAEIVERSKIEIGITQPTRVVLDRDGIRARAIFRDIDETYRNIRLEDGDYRQNLRDFYGFELVAYAVDRLLGLGMVPPVIERRLDNKPGVLQLWVEGAIMEKERAERGMSPQPASLWRLQTSRMTVFDYIIGNDDRHAQNMLADPDRWLLWLVDHTRAFQRDSPKVEALLNRINTIDDEMWAKLRSLDATQLEALLEEHLEGFRAREAMERYRNVVARIETFIAERGEGAVVYPAR